MGELFRYQIREPVVLARQQSAMLPIVNESIQSDKLSLYNPAVQARHPLNAVQLVNSTDLYLMQGPITVFDGGEYAGDARIEDLGRAAGGSLRMPSTWTPRLPCSGRPRSNRWPARGSPMARSSINASLPARMNMSSRIQAAGPSKC